MAFGDPIQWIVIAAVVLVLFMWGPQKIPDLARSIGRARREFDQASKEFNGVVSGAAAGFATDSGAPSGPAASANGDQVLLETAKRLGIATEGKTRGQLSEEILARAKHTP